MECLRNSDAEEIIEITTETSPGVVFVMTETVEEDVPDNNKKMKQSYKLLSIVSESFVSVGITMNNNFSHLSPQTFRTNNLTQGFLTTTLAQRIVFYISRINISPQTS